MVNSVEEGQKPREEMDGLRGFLGDEERKDSAFAQS
jgi:hypothetical protein